MNKRSIYRLAVSTLLIALTSAGSVFASAEESPWALTSVPVACVREKPGHPSELGTQVVLGTPLKVLGVSSDSDWLSVCTPEGYKGYVIRNSLTDQSEFDHRRWTSADRVVVTSIDQTYLYSTPEVDVRNRVSELVNGSIMTLASGDLSGDWACVQLPDGREGYVLTRDIADLSMWSRAPFSVDGAIDMAFSLMGSPYLWGGTSTKSVDCSGLTKVAFLSQGVILPRNASQQARIGTPLDINRIDLFEPGDLLFFGNRNTRRVNHVGIYIGDGKFIHCSGRVKVNSLDPSSEDYLQLYFLSATRLSFDDLKNLSVAGSPFYFSE